VLVALRESPAHRGHIRALKTFRKELRDEAVSLLDLVARTLAGPVAPFFTIFVVVIMCTLFSFLAAESSRLCLGGDGGERPVGPANLFAYLHPGGPVTLIDARYLYLWGAFFLPSATTSHGLFRWCSSSFLHMSLRHCLSNMTMYAAISAPFEMRVGTLRLAVVWAASALGGTITQAAMGNACAVLVGASGTVFGVVGALAADTALYWRRSKRPDLRVVFLVLLVGALLIQTPDSAEVVSSLAHAGGGVVGAAAAVLMFAGRPHARAPLLLKGASAAVLVAVPVLFGVAFARGRAAQCDALWGLPEAPACPASNMGRRLSVYNNDT
jgi:membrane associated rhomboid family serine protease